MSSITHPAQPTQSLIIRPSRGWTALQLKDVWQYRELLYFLIWSEVKVRYKQTLLGAAWAVLQPLTSMIVFTIFFSRIAGISSDGLPYPLFSYAGLLAWTFTSDAVSKASGSLVGSSGLLTKVYFPRLILPGASILSGLVDFGIAFLLLIVLMAYYGIWPTLAILCLPLFLLMAIGVSLGFGLWLSALNVKYRDVRYVVPFFIQLWLFVTPVIYPTARATAKLRELGIPTWVYGLNPMAGVVEGFRWSLLGSGQPGSLVLTSSIVTVVLLLGGAFYFRGMEKTFADVI